MEDILLPLLGCWKVSLFCSSSPDFFLPFLLLPCDVTSQNHNIVCWSHRGENLSDPWVFVHIDVFAVLQGSTCYHHKAFASTQFLSSHGLLQYFTLKRGTEFADAINYTYRLGHAFSSLPICEPSRSLGATGQCDVPSS